MPTPRVISLDFETFYDKGYSVKDSGPWRYCNDPQFDPFLISVSDGTDSWAGQPKDFNWDCLDGATLVSHNSQFDSTVLETMVKRGLAPQVNFKEWHCSANMSSYLCNRRSLKDAAAHLLGISLSKEVRDDAEGKHWDDFNPEAKAKMLAYARSDARICWELFDKHGHKWSEFERKLSAQTIRQGMRGICIDVELLKEYIGISQGLLIETEKTLPWVAEGKPPTSPKSQAERCRAEGIPCPPIQSHHENGPALFAAWEAAYSEKHPWVRSVSNWRSVNKLLDSLLTIRDRTDDDGIFRFGLKYCGAHTGRWSGDGGYNVQNMRKTPLYRDEFGRMISDPIRLNEIVFSKELPGYVTAVLDIRNLFIPRSGKKMIISDLAQIEARVLLWLAGDTEALAKIAAGKSVYQVHAEQTMEWTGGDLKKEDKELYALAKARCIREGTLVLTKSRGYVPIETIHLSDRVWDGHEWVSHSGLIDKGIQETGSFNGEFFTEDHEIFYEDTKSKPRRDYRAGENNASLALRRSSATNWETVWKVGSAVFILGAKEILSCGLLSLSWMRRKILGGLEQSPIRIHDAMRKVRSTSIAENMGHKIMGKSFACYPISPSLPGPLARNTREMSQSKKLCVSFIRRARDFFIRRISKR